MPIKWPNEEFQFRAIVGAGNMDTEAGGIPGARCDPRVRVWLTTVTWQRADCPWTHTEG